MRDARMRFRSRLIRPPGAQEGPTKMRLVLLLLCSLVKIGESLELLKLDVPSIADPRWDELTLRCIYDLGGKDLYSVKWYKDGAEFFRYMPGSKPSGNYFPVDGVYVDMGKSNSTQVTLLGHANNRREKIKLVGSYGCEVSSEAPNFMTIYGETNMSVAIPPKERPIIRGLRPSYQVGENLQAECSSAASYPPAQLVFILNGKEVVNEHLTTSELRNVVSSEDSIVSSTRATLSFRLERNHFSGGILTLTCRSSLPGVVGAKTLERTESATLAASNQRLAQDPPRSGCTIKDSSLQLIFIYCLLAIIGFFNHDILTFLHV